MTPAARVQAAIEVLDLWRGGQRADAALKDWGRAHRFAGSGDRAAIRDHVFGAIRCARSFAALGGSPHGRGLIIGALRAEGTDPAQVFGADRHAPAPLTEDEAAAPGQMSDAERLDCPDWLWPMLNADLGPAAADVLAESRSRAPVFLRVNTRKASREDAAAALAAEEIETRPHPQVPTALEVVTNARRVAASAPYADGRVEVQDAQSQAVVSDLAPRGRVLDYCAGAGGKALALAALTGDSVWAHDAIPGRMRDLGPRAERAGADIRQCATEDLAAAGPFDLVLCDAPCSGSGTWRRDPEAKWALTAEGLSDLNDVQDQVLAAAAPLVAPGGRLVYVTCSVLRAENETRAGAFAAAHPDWTLTESRRWPVGPDGDGFYRATLSKA